MKRINLAILGASGSIGRQTLSVADAHPDRFCITAVSVGSDLDALSEICAKYQPSYAGIFCGDVSLQDAKARPSYAGIFCGDVSFQDAKARIPDTTQIITGQSANSDLAEISEVDVVVIALPGMLAIHPLLTAARYGKKIAIANKECLVCGGSYVQSELKRYGAQLYPIDSEQSAIFQCLQGLKDKDEVDRLILTASGGPFLRWKKQDIYSANPAKALAHPNWSMGKKISVDSASLINKGLEVIEAHFLFDIPADNIDVLIHPQSIVHSMIETRDGALLAQLGCPDMRLPIQYAITFPERWDCPVERLDLSKSGQLTFEQPDHDRFPGLNLAYHALRAGGTATVIYNAADEAAVEAFLQDKIPFGKISECVHSALEYFAPERFDSLEQMLEIDEQTRRFVMSRIGSE